MEEITKGARTLDTVTAEIRVITENTRRVFFESVIEIGRRLIEAKELAPAGGWTEYLTNELGYKPSTAQNYMRIAREFGDGQMSMTGKDAKELFGNLSYSQLIPLIGLDEEEREEIAGENNLEEMSSREISALIKARNELVKAKEEADAEREKTQKEMEQYKNRFELSEHKIKSLEKASESAAQAAGVLQTKLDEANARADEAEKRAVEAEAQASERRELTDEELQAIREEIESENGEEMDKMREELQRAQESLQKVKNPAAHKVNFIFGELVEKMGRLKDAISELDRTDAESAGKMRGAINNVIGGWSV